MNAKDHRVALTVLGLAALAGAFYLGHQLFWEPFQKSNDEIDALAKANLEKDMQVAQIVRDRAKLAAWRRLSLPAPDTRPKAKNSTALAQDVPHTQERYVTFLRELMKRHKLSPEFPRKGGVDDKGVPKVAGNVPVYTTLTFRVEARGKLDNLVKMLEEFQTTPLLHRIRNLSIKQNERKGEEPLALTMGVEALIVNGSTNRGRSLAAVNAPAVALDTALLALRRRPTGLSVLPWHKLYAAAVAPRSVEGAYRDIALKNVFEGGAQSGKTVVTWDPKSRKDNPLKATPDLIHFAYLTDVTIVKAARATVYDRMAERKLDLRVAYGHDWIPLIKDCDNNTLVRGHVLSIDTRGVVFRVVLVARSSEEESEKMRFKTFEAIYSLPKEEVYELEKAKAVRPGEGLRLYKVHAWYWNHVLGRDKVVTEGKGGTFAFRWDLVRGKIVKRDERFVVIRLDERYCGFRPSMDRPAVAGPHLGYCFLGIGEKLSQGLQTPLNERELQETLPAAAVRAP